MNTPSVACLCPTYRARPARLVGNAIACFERQTYPAARLIVYDDTGHFKPASDPRWELITTDTRHATLSAKYNRLVELAGDADILVVWEDDDIYLPWHVEACVKALASAPWAHPDRVLSLYTGHPIEEGAAGRFHAALAFRREALREIGGWPNTARADFDQQLIAKLRNRFGPPANPCQHYPPSYVFRWASTQSHHGQNFMRSPADDQWYERATAIPAGRERTVVPRLDAETAALIRRFQAVLGHDS